MATAKYNWKNAPRDAIVGMREDDGSALWLGISTNDQGGWSAWSEIIPDTDILDDSGDWGDSLELHPSHMLSSSLLASARGALRILSTTQLGDSDTSMKFNSLATEMLKNIQMVEDIVNNSKAGVSNDEHDH